MSEPVKDQRPWFGPKRTGYGIGPRTWQGWAVVLGGAVIVILVARLLIR